MDGFFLIDKPKGMTSFAVCNQIKRKNQLNKCGHSGTLDPSTTGILVVACDQATKLLKLISDHDKEYIATIAFGYDSTTLDFDGEILNDIPMNVSMENVLNAIKELASREEQVPPMTSSIKIHGKKLYEYQRKNIEIEVPSRKTKIYDYAILSELQIVNHHAEITIRLHVAKGFYVRSFARDLGILLGGCAILKELRRTKVGNFKVEDATPLDYISEEKLLKIEDIFKFPKIEVSPYIAKLVKNGVTLDERQAKINEPFFVVCDCAIIAIYEVVAPFQYKPLLIFK